MSSRLMEVNSKIQAKPIRILHFISSLARGGRERQLATIVANSDIHKYYSKIIYFNETQNSYIEEYTLTDKLIQIKSLGRLRRLNDLYIIIKKEKPDIIFTWGNLESVFTLILKPFFKFSFINGSIRHGIRLKKFSHFFRSFILHLSRNVVSNSKAGLKANNLNRGYIIYNGIDSTFNVKLSEKEEADRRKSIPVSAHDSPLFISVANLVPYKDYFSVLKALQLVKKENYDFHYLILGDGPHRSLMEVTIKKYELEDNITLLGNVENVNEYLQIADIFIHSSKGEGCSNAILEAMAAGLPVIASNVGGIPETVFPGSSMLFPYKDDKALYQCLLKSQELKTSFNPKSEEYQVHLKKFSVDTMVSKFDEIIENVVRDKKKKIKN